MPAASIADTLLLLVSRRAVWPPMTSPDSRQEVWRLAGGDPRRRCASRERSPIHGFVSEPRTRGKIERAVAGEPVEPREFLWGLKARRR